jgi:NAD(P)-dependent dehydrogenase (short-subunit alcohol dehydrogenase family)
MTRPAIFISGSARGIGRATAQRFADAGYLVGVYDVDAEAVAVALAELGENAVGGQLDVTKPAQWRKALKDFTAASGGRLDILVNNAGILRAGDFSEVALAAHHLTIDINVNGVINGAYAAHPYLKATPGSQMVNLCSASAIYGQPDIAVYSASKFAVRGLTESLELEWRKDGIKVQAVWPLWVATDLLSGNHAGSTETLGVKLTVDDVAQGIWKATRPQRKVGLPRVHTAIGFPAKFLAGGAQVVPNFVTREINKRLSKA